MTIAVCAIVPEGVVLGADSTASMKPKHGGFHYFENNQKVFEIGENSTLGMVTWGLAALLNTSYRSLIGLLGDSLAASPPKSVLEVAERWVDIVWPVYERVQENKIKAYREIDAIRPRTPEAEAALAELKENGVGFCIAGHVVDDRQPQAYEIVLNVDLYTKPAPRAVLSHKCWGYTHVYELLSNGVAPKVRNGILSDQKWHGSEDQLDNIFAANKNSFPVEIPLRDAIDLVHYYIYATIKYLKFSDANQSCAGPIELAVVSTDRRFRWVTHKGLDSALDDVT